MFGAKQISERDFEGIIAATKSAVLGAIAATLPPEMRDYIDDVVQETYLRAFGKIQKSGADDIQNLSSYLYAVARNESLRLAKKHGRERVKESRVLEVQAAHARDEQVRAAELAEMRETAARLPPPFGEVMELATEGYSEKEIAERLNLPRGTVKSRLSRGRNLLRERMGANENE